MSIDDRFWAKVDICGADECWLWLAAKSSTGYGVFSFQRNKGMSAHRVAYILTHGPVAKGIDVDHLCRNRLCVNPSHLNLLTHKENLLKSRSYGPFRKSLNPRKPSSRIFIPKDVCKNGHQMTPENTYVHIRGKRISRECRICRKEHMRTFHKKRRSQDPTS